MAAWGDGAGRGACGSLGHVVWACVGTCRVGARVCGLGAGASNL